MRSARTIICPSCEVGTGEKLHRLIRKCAGCGLPFLRDDCVLFADGALMVVVTPVSVIVALGHLSAGER